MSVTISNCNEICSSPTNLSKSKMLYTFSKAQRFAKENSTSCDKFYQSTSSAAKRGTSFGYGKKYDFTSEAPTSPPPNTYNSQSEFTKDKKRGFCFGGSRVEMEITGPLVETIKNKNPGPGSYALKSMLDKKSYSIRKKIIKDDLWQKSIPGPGSYEPAPAINEKGFYYLAKFKSSGVHSFSMLPRKEAKTYYNVGPGAYEVKDSTSPDGKYLNSKCSNTASRHFARASRGDGAEKLSTPGPGYYRQPSQFGYYLSAKIKRNCQDKENLVDASKKQ